MNIAKKLLAAAGVKGAGATIDLVLDRTAYTPGDTITGRFQLKGGIAVQSISSLYAVIKVDVCKNGTWETHNVHPGGIVAEQNITIEPGEEKAIEFTEILPLTVAISDDNSVRYYIKTSLVIDNGKDASDTDVFDVVLPTRYDEIFHDLKVLGYEPKGNFMSFDGQRFRFLNSEHNIEAQLMLYPSHFGGTMVQCHLLKGGRIPDQHVYTSFFIPDGVRPYHLFTGMFHEALSNPDKFRCTEEIHKPSFQKSSYNPTYVATSAAIVSSVR